MNEPSAVDRRLLLLRHAKSAWPDVLDHDRPLAPRGQRDAPIVGRWLRTHGFLPEQVLCSSARRTRETWQLVHEQLGVEPAVRFDDQVYGATPRALLDLVHQAGPAARTLLVVGHDPAVAELARALPADDAAEASLLVRMREKFPTAAVAVVEFTGTWERLEPGTARLSHFVTPRELRGDDHTD
jgi:phosphohistidine phosphatase